MSAVAAKLIEECRSHGISLRPGEGGKLKVSPPPERLPVELREELKRHKPELLVLLTPPYLNSRGELIVPFSADPKYHWWAGGQSIRETLLELGAPLDVIARYVDSESSLKRMQ